MNDEKNVVISTRSIIFLLGILLLTYVVYKMSSIFIILIISLIISIALEQPIKSLVRKRLKRALAVYTTYFAVIFVGVGLFTLVAPPLIREVRRFLESLPVMMNNLLLLRDYGMVFSDVLPQITKIAGNVFSITISVFSNMAVLVSIFFLSVYISLDWENIKNHVLSFFRDDLRDEVQEVMFEIEVSISQWLKGQLILMLVVGLLSYISFLVIGIDYALALAVLCGLLEFVPMIGPIVSMVISTLIVLAQDPLKALFVLIACVVIQQLENNLLVPRVMQKVSGFSPLVILISVIAFTKFLGIVGTIIAVPCVMVGYVLAKRFVNYAGNE